MVDPSIVTHMASSLSIDDLGRLRSLLHRKLHNVPEQHLPFTTVDDILQSGPCGLHIATLPPDLQLPYFLRNRSLINRYNERPIKDEGRQPLKISRAIFFYHLSEVHQFQRFHDTARWNLAIFTALLSTPTPPVPPSAHLSSTSRTQLSPSQSKAITPTARRFMTSYLAAVLERHNTPTVFHKREAFIRTWKSTKIDLFVSFKAARKKLLKKAMQCINKEWESELDAALKVMGKKEYDACVAPFVGNIIHGRKDQGLLSAVYKPGRECTESETASESTMPHAREGEGEETVTDTAMQQDGPCDEARNVLLEALLVPLDDCTFQDKNNDNEWDEEAEGPVDVKVAIAAVQNVRPADMLRSLVRLFPVQVEERKSRWGSELSVRGDVRTEGERGDESVLRNKYCN